MPTRAEPTFPTNSFNSHFFRSHFFSIGPFTKPLATALGMFAALTLAVSPCIAQDDEDKDDTDLDERDAMRTRIETAVTLANRGHEELQAGNLDKAIRLLTEAERLAHSPVIVRYLAQAHRRKGHLTVARQLLRDLLAEALPKDAPLAFIEARAEARIELTELEDEMPTVRVTVTGPNAARAVVRLDGAPLAPSELRKELLIDPGQHSVSAQPAECEGSISDFSVALSEDKQISLQVEERAEQAIPPPIAAAPAPVTLSPAQLGGAIAFGIGGAALVAGAGTLSAYLARRDALADRCPDDLCPVGLRDEVGAVETLGTVSLVSMIGAGVAGGAGALLWFLSPDTPTQPELGVGPGALGVRGSF